MVLRAGASYDAAWGRSLLEGGTSTGTELLEANVTLPGFTDPGVDIVAGGGPAIIDGSAGGDNIVAGQGPDLITATTNDNFYFESGFGNDRIYVTGGNNAVSFDGWTLTTQNTGSTTTGAGTQVAADVILTSAELAQFITPLSVAAITTPLTLSFGPLVESAVSGSSTVFFATDPSETQQISTWTGGVGGDTYNVYYFAPEQTLTLNVPVASKHVNTFNIFFGNPNVVYVGVISLNMGTINLHDTNSNDVLDIDQTFPETVNSGPGASGYSAAYLNGRETLNYDTNLLVNYNAPNSTIVLGNASDKTDFDPINAASYNVGTIIFVSPVEFESSNVVIKVKNTLDIIYAVNVVGPTANASLEIDITNAFPTGESDLTFESGAVLGMTTTSKANTSATGVTYNSLGTITLNINSGSLENVNDTNKPGGSISIINGTLIISALTSIGTPDDHFTIIAGQLIAQTTSLNNVSGRNGIFITSPDDLHITATGTINGLNAAAGDIYVDVTGGHTLYYYQINAAAGAGSLGGNVTLIADDIQPIASFPITRDIPTLVQVTQQIVTITPVFNLVEFEVALLFGGFDFLGLLPLFISYSVQVTDVVVGYQTVEKATPVTLGGASGSWTLTPATVSNPAISYTSAAAITVISKAGTALSGAGPLVIGGHTLVAGDIGKYVDITDQTDPTQDGIYSVTAVSANPDSISGTGTLNIANDSSGATLEVGGSSPPSPPDAGLLYISSTILSEIQPGFTAITFGHASTDSTLTGAVIVYGADFDQASNIIFQGGAIDVLGSVTNDHASVVNGVTEPDGQLQFNTYGSPATSTSSSNDGHINFSTGTTTIADTINISTQANLDLKGTFLAEDAAAGVGRAALNSGLIQIKSAGTVLIDASTQLKAIVGSQSSISITGASVTVDPASTIQANNNLTIIATDNLAATAGMISEASTTPNRVKATNLILQATQGISLYSNVLNVLSVTTTTGPVTLNNDDSSQLAGGAVNVDAISTGSGAITFTNVGNIDLVRGNNVTSPLIQTGATSGNSVTLTSISGAITGDTSYDVSEDDIKTNTLSLNSSGAIGDTVFLHPIRHQQVLRPRHGGFVPFICDLFDPFRHRLAYHRQPHPCRG